MIVKQILSSRLRTVRSSSGSFTSICKAATTQSQISPTQWNPSQTRLLSSLPYHIVVGMPALSPTMEAGTLSEWKVKEGESFSAGDSVAEIETDKATIDFEAQDDGVVAKILKEAGTGEEIKVGVPIMVTVEEEEDVAAFADFVAPEAEKEEVAAEPTPTPEPTPPTPTVAVEASPPPPPPAPTPPVSVSVSEVSEVSDISTTEQVSASLDDSVSPSWGNFAKVKSPLAKTLSAKQHEYIKLYGSTGQIPL